MNEQQLSDALRDASDDDGGARERSWRVVRAAYDERDEPDPHRLVPRRSEPRRRRLGARRPHRLVPLPLRLAPRRPFPALAALVAAAAVAVAGVAAASAPRSDVGRWVRSVLGAAEERARPALVRVPGGGRLLVEAGDSVWVVAANGSRRRLGAYAGASWSPNARFVVAWRGRQLSALDDRGRTRWSLARPSPIMLARWSPVDGFRIAYLTRARPAADSPSRPDASSPSPGVSSPAPGVSPPAVASLRIVNGDGTGDRRFGPARAGVAPAWRPDAAHVLAYAGAGGRVAVVAVDTRLRLWRTPVVRDVRELAWSPDGRRLLVLAARRLLLFGRDGRLLRSDRLAAETEGVQWSPDGRTVAAVRRRSRGSEIVLLDAARGLRERVILPGPGRFGPPAWSPDGRFLLLPWPEADQWLFLRPRGGRLQAVASIAGHFRAGPAAPAFPRSVSWR